jgi:outer membrane protein TolC
MNRFGVALIATMFIAPVVNAAEAGTRVLSLEEALIMARKSNRTLAVERARLEQVQTNVAQAWAALFPTVGAQGRYTHNYKEFELGFTGQPLLIQPSEQFDGAISFTAPLLAPAAYPALKAVKATVRAAEANYKVSDTTLLVNVAHTFYRASIADEVLVARRSGIEVAQATLKNARSRFEAGTVTKVDVHRAELALVRAEQLEREARDAQDSTYRALGTLIQFKGPFQVHIAPIPPERHDERELDQALRLRPESRALQATIESAQSQVKAHGWRWAPTLSLFGNARKFNYDNFARDRYSWAFGGQLDWQLYDGGIRDAQRHLAAAQVTEAKVRADMLRESVRDDLADGRRRLETSEQRVTAAQRSVALARETLELVRVQYEAGSVTQVDLLQAQDALVSSQEALAHAHFDVAAADLLLRRAAGTFPPH